MKLVKSLEESGLLTASTIKAKTIKNVSETIKNEAN